MTQSVDKGKRKQMYDVIEKLLIIMKYDMKYVQILIQTLTFQFYDCYQVVINFQH